MKANFLGIEIDYSRNDLLTPLAKILLKEKYCKGLDIQEVFAKACVAFSTDQAHAQRMYDYVSKLWFMFSTPILANAPMPGEDPKGYPISCFLGFVDDSLESLIDHSSEIRWLSVRGGGVGGHWDSVRSVSEKSPGPIPFLQTIDSDMDAYRQGSSRRGSYAAYLDVSHPDIEEFLQLRSPTGGDPRRKCHSIGFHHAVNITDAFMKAVQEDLDWDLIDPSDGSVRSSLRARELWEKILEMRYRTGEPYLNFIDTANNALNRHQRDAGMTIKGSNLCVAPETLILTDTGYHEIASLEDNIVKVWNGEEFSETIVRKTGTNQELVTVTLSNGATIDCTPYHKFWVKPHICVEAKNLTNKDVLIRTTYPDGTSLDDVQVVSVEWNGRHDDTFCFNEPKKNLGVFNGILTGNCNEIHLVTDEDRTAVCCLSSINAEKYDEWWESFMFIPDLVEFLDNVLEKFIEWTDGAPGFEKARFSAMSERSIGIGMLGLHSLYQKYGFAFGSDEAKTLNKKMFKEIREEATFASQELAKERGEPEDIKESGMRNAHLMAIAPNANSGLIAGTSPSIEPWAANAYTTETRVGSHLVKNPHLVKLLQELDQDTPEVWKSIIAEKGSVQHLKFLTDDQKDVFKTAMEINQEDIIIQAANRQVHICQGQSLNLFFPRASSKEDLNRVHYLAWEMGCKGLYYLRTEAEGKVNDISAKKTRVALKDYHEMVGDSSDDGSCEACEG